MHKPQRTMTDDARDGFNMAAFLLNSHAMTILNFTRTGMGVRGGERLNAAAAAMILVYGCMTNSPVMLLVYFPAWLLMVVRQRLFPDRRQHSRYQGWPWLVGWLVKDEYQARCVEAALLLLFGSLLFDVSPAAGLFLLCGSVSLTAKYVVEHVLHERRVRAWNDWQAEAEEWQDAMYEAQRRFKK
jgi:hypothetical protein